MKEMTQKPTEQQEMLADIKLENKMLRDAIRFFEKNRKVLEERLLIMEEGDARDEYEDAVRRLRYAAQGCRRMLADACNAQRAVSMSTVGAKRYFKTKWQLERTQLQKRISEQRQQLDWLLKNNQLQRGVTQEMLQDRVKLLTENAALKEDCTALHHSWPDGRMCDGCPKAEGCLHLLATDEE